MVADDVPDRVFTSVRAAIEAGRAPRAGGVGWPVAMWRWRLEVRMTAATALLAVSFLWWGATPPHGPDAGRAPRSVAVAVPPDTVDVEPQLDVEPPIPARVRSRRVPPAIPGPVRVEPVSVAVVEVGSVEIPSVEVGHTEVARVELEPTRIDIVQ